MYKRSAFSALFTLLLATPALANCYEGIGCTNSDYFAREELKQMSCQILWEVRNQIYHENGYCFQSGRGQAMFSNENCSVYDAGSVKLNAYERANVGAIKKVERAKGC